MYRCKITDEAIRELKTLAVPKATDGILKKISELQDNPEKIAKPIAKKILGDYYLNAGNLYAVVFNIDKSTETIEILAVKRRAYLYKLLSGKIVNN